MSLCYAPVNVRLTPVPITSPVSSTTVYLDHRRLSGDLSVRCSAVAVVNPVLDTGEVAAQRSRDRYALPEGQARSAGARLCWCIYMVLNGTFGSANESAHCVDDK